ncbi:hypothetical protein [Microbacterium sp. NPDC076911]|uniref:hypothetical protein n=1 Tax=Microbacterium sp. NPDC076911 TaxID=3154958 RepID=UPI0034143BA5
MSPADLVKLRELTLLLDLAYIHKFERDADADAPAKSAEGTVRLEFGNHFWRRENAPVNSPEVTIEDVVVYSSVFSANRISHFDSLDDAIAVVRGWYTDAKAKNESRS